MQPSIENITFKRKPRAVSTFLKKTYDLLNDQQNFTCIKWAPNGIGFIVTNQEQFSRIVLPKYFKHSNYSSFVRQLNMYNFHKIRETNSESYFHHEHFDKGNRNAMSQIKRKPQKKKKKFDDSEDQINQNQDDIIQQKFCVRKSHQKNVAYNNQCKSQVGLSIEVLKSCNFNNSEINIQKAQSQKNTTRHLFSQTFNPYDLAPYHPRQQNTGSQRNIQLVQEDDKLSINDQIAERVPKFNAKELFCASNNNLFQFIGNFQPSTFSIFY